MIMSIIQWKCLQNNRKTLSKFHTHYEQYRLTLTIWNIYQQNKCLLLLNFEKYQKSFRINNYFKLFQCGLLWGYAN